MMRGLFARGFVGVAAVAMALGLSACGSGDSTVSAPISSVTAPSASDPSVSSSTPSATADDSAGSSLPATAPQVDQSAPSGFPGGAAAPQGSRGQAYLGELRRQGVSIPNDADNSIALGAAEYVCAQRGQNAPASQIKTFVTAIVASGTTDAAAASANADKVIAAATSTYCRR